eukprot:1942694-Pyramimonas_sp.AAC.1
MRVRGAGEYGMHNDEPMGRTHRKLFSEWYTSVRASLFLVCRENIPCGHQLVSARRFGEKNALSCVCVCVCIPSARGVASLISTDDPSGPSDESSDA